MIILGLETHEDYRSKPDNYDQLVASSNVTASQALQFFSKPQVYIIVLELFTLIILTTCSFLSISSGIVCRLTSQRKFPIRLGLSTFVAALSLLPAWFVVIYKHVMGQQCSINYGWLCKICGAVRIARVLFFSRMVAYFHSMAILLMTLKASLKELILLGISLLIGALVFGSCFYYIEADKGTIPHIPYGYWWAIVTMTTVGYGDVYPVTTLGYFVGSFCAFFGIIILALPIPVITKNFSNYYTCVKRIEMVISKENKHGKNIFKFVKQN